MLFIVFYPILAIRDETDKEVIKMESTDDVRRRNLQLLMDQGLGTVTYLARKSGISRSTLSSVMNGKTMLNKHAKEIERAFDKNFGWLDLSHDTKGIIEYEKAMTQAALKCIYNRKEMTAFYNELSTRGKIDLLDKLMLIFSDPVARELKQKTLMIMLGINDDGRKKRKSKDKSTSPKNSEQDYGAKEDT